MGTRADYYIGLGTTAEWLGSTAYDGYPEGVSKEIQSATSEVSFRAALSSFAEGRDDWTGPEQGWPWPWDDSGTTDYAYCFDPASKRVRVIHFGKNEDESEATFPDMKNRKNVTFGKRSGMLIIGG